MTADPVTTSPSSRRALLAGALGAAAASVASALGRPDPAHGADGDAVILGSSTNWASATTKVSTTTGIGLYGESADTSGTGLTGYAWAGTGPTRGVWGQSSSTDGTGVFGYAGAGTGPTRGVWGQSSSTDGTGVLGYAGAGTGPTRGVYGQSSSTAGFGVLGYAAATSGSTRGVYGRVDSPAGTGVIGYSGTGADPAPVAKTGVYGYAAQDSNSRGVHGRTVAGRGVYGQAGTGQGVRGYAATGAAGYFSTSGLKKGLALRTVGRVKLDNSVGIATITSGTSSVVVTPGINLVSTSAVVASLMGSAGGTTTVHRSVVNATADTFTIFLTAAATANVKVAWHVFG